MNIWFGIANARKWLYAVIFQGKRLLEHHDYVTSIMSSLPIPMEQAERATLWEAFDKSRIEAHFFIIAMNQSMWWLNEMSNSLPEIKACAEKLNFNFPLVKDTRDTLEHYVHSYTKGKKPKKKMIRDFGRFKSDATSIGVDEGAYLIGGGVNVQQAILVAEEILPIVQAWHDKLLMSKKHYENCSSVGWAPPTKIATRSCEWWAVPTLPLHLKLCRLGYAF